MLSRSFHNAMHEVKNLGISTEEAISKHGQWMTYKEENIIRKMEVKAMKNVVKRTHGNGNNAKISYIVSVEYPKNIKIESLKKAPKVSDSKVFKLMRDDSIDNMEFICKMTFIINENKAIVRIDNPSERTEKRVSIETAREIYRKALKWGYEKVAEEKPAKPCKTKEASKKQTEKRTSKKSEKADSKKTAKKAKKETTKKASKKATKKDTAKKATTKKDNKVGVKETAKKESKVFILKKGNKMYRFTVTKNRGILVKGDGYRYVRTEEARWIYRNLLKEGYKRVA